MAIVVIILSAVLGIGLSVFLFFLIRSTITPKKLTNMDSYLKQGKTAQVIKTCKAVLSKDNRNVESHFYLAKAYLAEGKNELALMEIKSVNKIGDLTSLKNEVEFRQMSADLYRQFGNDDEALKDYILLIKMNPYEADNYYNAGTLFESRKKPGQAVKYYKKALELQPHHSNAHQKLGMIMYNNKRLNEAKKHLDLSIRYDMSNFKTHFYIGRIQKEARDYMAAIESFEKAMRDPDIKLKALIDRGSCFLTLQQFQRAQSELEKAIQYAKKTNQDNTVKSQQMLYARYFLSLAYELQRKYDDAISLWEYLYQKNKNFKDVAEKLSQYKELRHDDNIKDFLTSSNNEFTEICKKICLAIKLSSQDIKEIKGGLQILALEGGMKQWRNTKKMPTLIRFIREGNSISEANVRDILDEMKRMNLMKAKIISSNTISREAKAFAESRPVDLIGKDKLLDLLKVAQQMKD